MTKQLTFFEKCLQVLALIHMTLNISVQITIFLTIIYITFFTKYWLFTVLAVAWTWYDQETGFKGGRRYLLNLLFLPSVYFFICTLHISSLKQNFGICFPIFPKICLKYSDKISYFNTLNVEIISNKASQ